MYNVSNDYINLITSQYTNIEWNYIGTITTTDNTVYNFTVADLKQNQSTLTREICTSDYLEIGTTCSAELKLGIFLQENDGSYYLDGKVVDRYAFYDAVINLTFRLFIGQGHEDVPCGVFTVSDASRTSNVLTLVGYDNMIKFSPSLSSPEDKTCYDWLTTACTSCGVTLGNTRAEIEAMPNGTFITGGYEVSTKIQTWRDLIGHVASMLCGYAYIGRDGKLYIGQYGMTPVRTIGTGWRYTSNIADYETYYSSLTFTNDRRNETETVTVTGDGLNYEMADNPLIQYPNKYAIQRRIQEILDALATISYTPFEIKTPLDPALDIGDVIGMTGNQAASGKYAAITSIVLPLNGSMTLKGVGQNPRLKDKSIIEKKLDELVDTAYTGEARYDHYVSDNLVSIAEGTQERVILLTYDAASSTHVDFHGEVKCNVTVTPHVIGGIYGYLHEGVFYEDDEYTTAITPEAGKIYVDTPTNKAYEWVNNAYSEILDPVMTENATLTATYYVDGVEFTDYHPQTTITDSGVHLLNLMFFWIQKQKKRDGTFVVWLSITGGSMTINAKDSRGYICSQGWDSQNSDDYDDPRYLIYIDVTSLPTKTTYNLGETLNYDGVQVMAFYSDDTMSDITYDCVYTPAHGTSATSGLTDVIVTYTKDGERYQTSFPVIIEGEYDDVYEVNGGQMIIATAATSMAKGDTVYFVSNNGNWEKINNTGFTQSFNLAAISSDGSKAYSVNNHILYVYDTSTIPWTKTQISTGEVSQFGQDGDIGLYYTYYSSGNSSAVVINLLTGETIWDIPIGGDSHKTPYSRCDITVFGNVICVNEVNDWRYTQKINISSGVLSEYYVGVNLENARLAWIDEYTFFCGTSKYSVASGSGERIDYISDVIPGSTISNIIVSSERMLIGHGDSILYELLNYNDSHTNWVLNNISANRPTNFDSSLKYASFNKASSKLLVPDSGDKVVAILNTKTMTWNVLDYYAGTSHKCALDSDIAICGNDAFVKRNVNTVYAYKANNFLHGVDSLGYATENVASGARSRFRVLFS